jgi:hypothetical protein
MDDDLLHPGSTTGTLDGRELGEVRSRPDDVKKFQEKRRCELRSRSDLPQGKRMKLC